MKSSFQTILIVVFIIAFAGSIAVFSGLFSSNKKAASTEPEGTVFVWGVLPRELMQRYVEDFNGTNQGYTVSYEEHNPANFNQDLIEALADGSSPDVVIFSSEIFSQFQNKLYTIPYAAYSERTYRDTNIDGAQLFLNAQGVLAMPILVDPLVVYYNKDLLARERFVVSPKTWGSLTQSISLFTKKAPQGGITQSTVALGETQNINHVRDILSALFLQTGNQIVAYDTTLLRNVPMLANGTTTADALTFYTSFSNPTNANYSWNRSLPNSLDMFLAGKSVFYIGRASELFTIQAQNPNLNFDISEFFQPDSATRPVTYGSFIGAGVMQKAPNFTAAYAFASTLATPEAIDKLSKIFTLPPVRRDLLLVHQDNPYVAILFRAALSAFSWPDPNLASTEQIFRDMITKVTSGRTDAQTAIYEATQDLQTNMR
jgi:ABC-type glycerol-3-phosphate transport system substrate-binding protein